MQIVYLLLVLAKVATADWFNDLVSQETLAVNKKYPMPHGSELSLIEACGGVGSQKDKYGVPGACVDGKMKDVTSNEIKFVRLVFVPLDVTKPSVLAMHNVTTNTTDYLESDENWLGDNQHDTRWNESISLTDAHKIYTQGIGNLTNGGELTGFIWRQLLIPCVTQPSFIIHTV